MNPYRFLPLFFPKRKPPPHPARIVLILPCCIGDVVMATATLKALRRGYPNAHITWAVGSWSRKAIEDHDLLDDLLDTGEATLPVKSWEAMRHFARQLRAGEFDLAVSLVRSPLMSAAVLLSGIPYRAGLNSAGRGFGYNIRAKINPAVSRHEGEIYLDVARALKLDTADCYANVPVRLAYRAKIRGLTGAQGRYIVLNPAGGQNPGMMMDAKRWPPAHFAALADRLSAQTGARIVLIGGPNDHAISEAVLAAMTTPALDFTGKFSFGEIAALAAESLLYVGNDTGLTHFAAAAGAKTVMILGPTDPARYAPFTPNSHALWKPTALPVGGVASGVPADWDWARDGISIDEAFERIMDFLG
ncbi:MAG: glycosyltransferase family 9 protein [Chitinophagaceae bacterium]|nr:glycosyltransferase family 9 protein [Anaerolineae bacterium]